MNLTALGGIMISITKRFVIGAAVIFCAVAPLNVHAEESVSTNVAEVVAESVSMAAAMKEEQKQKEATIAEREEAALYLYVTYGFPGVPEDIELMSYNAELIYGTQAELIQSIAWVESNYNPNAKNGGCKGLCQLAWKYHKKNFPKDADPYDPQTNIYGAALYMQSLYLDYGNLTQALNTYNGRKGSKRNTKYTRKVNDIYDHLLIINGDERRHL